MVGSPQTRVITPFRLPIQYVSQTNELPDETIAELELIQTAASENDPIYDICYAPTTKFGKKIAHRLCKHYTTDILFLSDTKQYIQEISPFSTDEKIPDYDTVVSVWDDIRDDVGFKERFNYIDWEYLEWLNHSELFLECMCLSNLISPVISLLIPIFLLLVPFFILCLQGICVSFRTYMEAFKSIANYNSVAALLTADITNMGPQGKASAVVNLVVYLFSIYQNFSICIRFNRIMRTMHSHFSRLSHYIKFTLDKMDTFCQTCDILPTYARFISDVSDNANILRDVWIYISKIPDSYNMFTEAHRLGGICKWFYDLHTDASIHSAMLYSYEFHGFIECMDNLRQFVKEGLMGPATYCTDVKQMKIINGYYAPLKYTNPVKNSISFRKHWILTGPNACGKTTMVKSVIINLLFSQQVGFGFFDSACIRPADYIHCYLNIPDTSGRDSLFQAEARQCKKIIDTLLENPTKFHFCIFDELFSGTNPKEAEMCASAFMEYLTAQGASVRTMLTTHYTQICKNLSHCKMLQNAHMDVVVSEDGTYEYNYKLTHGLSTVCGGLRVLKSMDFPQEFIKLSEHYSYKQQL